MVRPIIPTSMDEKQSFQYITERILQKIETYAIIGF